VKKRDQAPETSAAHLEVYRDVSILLLAIGNQLQNYFADCAKELDLTASQAKILMALSPEVTIAMRDLAQQLGYDPSNLTGPVDKLESRSAVRRQPDQNDRRIKGLVITKEGIRIRDAFWRRLVRDPGPLRGLKIEEARRLRHLLQLAMR